MILDRVLLLAAYTPRSQAYAEALLHADLLPSHVVMFGDATKQPMLMLRHHGEQAARLEETVKKYNVPVTRVTAAHINDEVLLELVKKVQPRLVIYAGYGGQIVGKKLLALGMPFLHIHSGFLPDYPGSTTLYYSILNERRCGVSALLLSPEIDRGTIVKRKHALLPAKGVNIDYDYDNLLRAELLVEVLSEWSKEGRFSEGIPQTSDGPVYYVIHPVLKHLALLSLSS